MKYLFVPIALGAAVLGYVANGDRGSVSQTPDVATLDAVEASEDYISLDSQSEPLKTAFNADVDKTRILMLVAPT